MKSSFCIRIYLSVISMSIMISLQAQSLKNLDENNGFKKYKLGSKFVMGYGVKHKDTDGADKIESFKWWDGDTVATLVSAAIDWNNYSVKEFQNHKLRKGKAPEFIARLKGESNLKIEVGELRDSLLITDLPWQSYDFDFFGLSFIWRSLINKKAPFWFHIADVAMINGNPKFINKGKVTVTFIGDEMVHNKPCLKYFVNGPGLENQGGDIWVNQENFMIEQYKIALPDEPGFVNGMMELVKAHKMSPEQWENFKRKKLGD